MYREYSKKSQANPIFDGQDDSFQTITPGKQPASQENRQYGKSLLTSIKNIQLGVDDLDSQNPHEQFKDVSYIYPVKDEVLTFINRFCSEKLTGMGTLPSAKFSSLCNIVCSFFFMIFGLVFLVLASNVNEIRARYDDSCSNQQMCIVNFTLINNLQGPIFLYYELDGFYSNHKLYSSSNIQSYIDSLQGMQMFGDDLDVVDQSLYCLDAQYNSDMPRGYLPNLVSGTGYLLDNLQSASPCGVSAKYIFNGLYFTKIEDSFVMIGPNLNQTVYLNQSQIKYQVDDQYKYARHQLFPFRQWLDMDNALVINWFGIQTLPQMMKLWARIDINLHIGNYQMLIYNNYPSTIFNGQKSFILSTTSEFGANNVTFGWILIAISIFYFIGFIQIYLKGANVAVKQKKIHPQAQEGEQEDSTSPLKKSFSELSIITKPHSKKD